MAWLISCFTKQNNIKMKFLLDKDPKGKSLKWSLYTLIHTCDIRDMWEDWIKIYRL